MGSIWRWRVRHGLGRCVVRYRKDILLPHVVPFVQAHPDMTLQHDNATSHIARSVRHFLPWKMKSPELNLIEHVWYLLDRRVRLRAIPPRNVLEFASALLEECGKCEECHSKNWQIWCTAVLNAAGAHTRY